VQLAQNILRAMVALGVMAVAVMFAYAGFLYVTAASNQSNLDSAKKIFWNALIGLIFILLAYIIVDLVLKTLTGQPLNAWSKVQCVAASHTGAAFSYQDVPDAPPVQGTQGGDTPPGQTDDNSGEKNKGLDNVDSNTNYNPFQCTVISLDYHECKDPNVYATLSARGKQECVQGCEYSSNGKPIITVQDYKDCKAGGQSSNPHLTCAQILARGVTVAAPQDSGIPKGTKFTWPELAERYGLPPDTVFTADDRYSDKNCNKPTGCIYGHPEGRSTYSVDVARCGEWNKRCKLPSYGSGTPMKTKPTPVPGG
jgi:hypothetical protein